MLATERADGNGWMVYRWVESWIGLDWSMEMNRLFCAYTD